MLTKKYTIKSDSKIDGLIASLINGQYDKSSSQAQLLAQSQPLKFYFTDLQQHITPNNILLVRKYDILQDGLYVLLKGQISFKQFTTFFQNQRELNRSKNLLRNSSAMNYISQALSVFQSSMKNSAAIEDSYLLRIFECQKFQTKFEQKFIQRKNLCDNYYLSHYHELQHSDCDSLELITADFKLHSNFVYKSYSFRQTLSLRDISIIKQGRVKFTSKGNAIELEKYALLLPDVMYEVTTSSLWLLTIYGNEPFKFKSEADSQITKELKHCWFPAVNKINFSINSQNAEQSKPAIHKKYQKGHNKKQRLKRQKEITKLSKDSQSYSIISSFLCKKSLDFAKRQIIFNKSKEPYFKHNKTPVILFNLGCQKTNSHHLRHAQKSLLIEETNTGNDSKERERLIQGNELSQKQNILRKLKLPFAEYQKMVKKHALSKTCSNLKVQNKGRSLFTLTLAKHYSDTKQNMRSQEQAFVRYRDS